MRASRAVASAALGACTACVALVVRAQPAVDAARRPLSWRAPAGCPDEASVNADVARLLAGSSAPLSASAEVERAGASWRVVVSMNGGVRRLEASSCRALAEATELIVAMAVDPARVAKNRATPSSTDAGVAEVAAEASAPSALASVDGGAENASSPFADASPPTIPLPIAPAVNVEVPPVDASAPAPPPPGPALPRATAGTTFAIQAAGTVDFGTLPAPSIGPSIALAWTPAHLRFELSGAYFFPSSTGPIGLTFANERFTVSERFTMLTAALRACYLARAGAFDVGPCVEGEVASIHGEGLVAQPSSRSVVRFAPGAGLFGAWRVARAWALFGRADALIPTTRNDFQVDSQTLHTPAFLAVRLSLGAELRF